MLLRIPHRLVRKTQETQSSHQQCINILVNPTSSKKSQPPSAPFPTVAQSDYFQNGLVLPTDPKNLELILRDVDAKGYLDIELVCRPRQKESLGSVKQKLARKIQQDENSDSFEESVLSVLVEAVLKHANDSPHSSRR